ncbi:MAG TPA: hypothetical protein PLK99_03025, partial [Burkholderiales bacterium]|nr:hypothetical protein [Burkholderiales bacterium]
MRKCFAGFLVLLSLCGCALHAPLKPVGYEKSTSVTSSQTVNVEVTTCVPQGTGSTSIVPIGNVYVPVAEGPYTFLMFTEEDQRIFVDSLRKELVRLKLFRADSKGHNANDNIKIVFLQTFHEQFGHVYLLNVEMQLSRAGRQPLIREYRINS